MFCVQCGNQLNDVGSFCPLCGTNLHASFTESIDTSVSLLNKRSGTRIETWPGESLGLPIQGVGSLANPLVRFFSVFVNLVPAAIFAGLVAIIGRKIIGPVAAPNLGCCYSEAGFSDLTYPLPLFLGFRDAKNFLAVSGLLILPVWFIVSTISISIWGRTLGQFVFGLKILRIDNWDTPGFGKSLGRCSIQFLPLLIAPIGLLFLLVNFSWAIFDERRQCLYDKAVNTVVIKMPWRVR